MNTHLIIPIKDIEQLLDNIQSACNLPVEDGDILISRKFTEQYLTNCKQISLDEKDIEERAKLKFPSLDDSNDTTGEIEEENYRIMIARYNYKQALKDLI